jgi:uncharacterized protein (TIGR03086 family)
MDSHPSPVEVDTWLPVSPEAAFALVTEPARLRRWLMVAGHIDLQVGGEVHLVVAPGAHAVGRVTEIEPGRRFTYTHGWVDDPALPPGSSEVSITLEPHGGGTTVTVRHHGIPQAHVEGMSQGWDSYMQRLAGLVSGHDGAADWPAELEVSSPAAVLDSALFTLLAALRSAAHTPRDAPTPCADFTLGQLVDHLVGNARMLGAALSAPAPAGPTTSLGWQADPEDAVARELWPAVAGAQNLLPGQQVELAGSPVESGELVAFLSVEFLVHAWDVSQSTGSTLDASPELCAAVLDHAHQVGSSAFFTGGQFDPPVEVPAGTPPLEQLIALTGRRPSCLP